MVQAKGGEIGGSTSSSSASSCYTSGLLLPLVRMGGAQMFLAVSRLTACTERILSWVSRGGGRGAKVVGAHAEGADMHLREARAPRIPVYHFPEVASSLRGHSVFSLDKVSVWRYVEGVGAKAWLGPVSAPCE